MPRELITEAERTSAAVGAENAKRYHCWPGIVQAYHPPSPGSPASVDVKPAVHDVRLCVQDDVPTEGLVVGQRYREPWPVMPKVPIQYPRGGGRAIWWPLAPGDHVLLLAFDLDPSTYLTTGQEADPPLTRRNSGTHWVALPGDLTDPGALPDPGQAICIGTPGGVVVTVDGSSVNLGAAQPTDAAALASKVLAELGKIETALGSLTVTTGPGTGGTVVAGTPYSPSTVASKTVKIAP